MENTFDLFKFPFVWGLLLGLLFAGLAAWSWIKLRFEYARYKKMLSDKLELEASQHRRLNEEKERLTKENENLRIKVGSTGNNPVRELERELEILARAERAMNVNAPGFAGAWEAAKSKALGEVQDEESGKSIPQRIYRKLFKGGSGSGTGDVPALAEKSQRSRSSSTSDSRNEGNKDDA